MGLEEKLKISFAQLKLLEILHLLKLKDQVLNCSVRNFTVETMYTHHQWI